MNRDEKTKLKLLMAGEAWPSAKMIYVVGRPIPAEKQTVSGDHVNEFHCRCFRCDTLILIYIAEVAELSTATQLGIIALCDPCGDHLEALLHRH